ncbi:MAG: dinitrogenase iron-molybdenum cofactor biosynthesis protein [Desulfurococcales archaeon ex4484_58]|nr:MAG: dinitrogenase iron-molybdenum cofactor biosynthesis protein [Desulfurococcales archaeon ex4484_58]
MVRIAFPTDKGGLDDQIYPRFGRAPTFTIVEVEDGEIKDVRVVQNPGSISGSGAGIRAVQKLVEEKIDIVIGPSPGPNAYMALQQSGIRVVMILGVTVREALEKFLSEEKK